MRLQSSCLVDNESRITFLLSLAERVAPAPPKKGEEHLHRVDLEATSAQLLAQTLAAYYQLLSGQYTTVYAHIAASEKLLDSLDGVDGRVSSAFYRVAADYYKAKLQYAKFYKTSLLFLGCLGDVNELPLDEAVERAHDLSLAALLSDEIYNFGELLMHQILEKLDNSPHAWLNSASTVNELSSTLREGPPLRANGTRKKPSASQSSGVHFKNGAPPPARIVSQWLALVAAKFVPKNTKDPPPTGPIAVHCVAGLGRAPVLVAIALIEAGMPNLEAVEYIRSRRRGALNMKQIHFLDSYKRRGKGKLIGACGGGAGDAASGDGARASPIPGKDKDKCTIM
ncbi:hypothetical protein AMAG_03417 [Allomyces macrogynus ATCC 38327]|uniref:Tyrosine specific protein phosphatases domain-containing protein n=1 Tax=Allomyces macrogynus (strain ATCC 38327) TaxID=578462 RepID=A0A0L0S9K3_ALLM3|nr:hypothetical protein AMAG_03417 [Allomyces macrogynus ATCC 38327]|eukprot:KNE59069.1 hypothetical protein AMAG_03417 [Allomyces macrogynus ATCC 38327]